MKTRHTILVVDDEADVVSSIQELLRQKYRVLGATRAAEGLEILLKEDVQVIVTDQRMPGMTGVELLRRARAERPSAVRILITGYADIRDVIDAINHGHVYQYVTKPWDPEALLGVIHDAAGRYEAQRELERGRAELEARIRDLAHMSRAIHGNIARVSVEARRPDDASANKPVEIAVGNVDPGDPSLVQSLQTMLGLMGFQVTADVTPSVQARLSVGLDG
jgi:response regulator RpfG family c-di-GMP phosphodiesterase